MKIGCVVKKLLAYKIKNVLLKALAEDEFPAVHIT